MAMGNPVPVAVFPSLMYVYVFFLMCIGVYLHVVPIYERSYS